VTAWWIPPSGERVPVARQRAIPPNHPGRRSNRDLSSPSVPPGTTRRQVPPVASAPRRSVGGMPYPSRLLDTGEEVALEVRPHWWPLTGPAAVVVLALAGAVATAVEHLDRVVDAASGVVLVAALVWLVGRYARWAATALVVTTERVVWRRGLVVRRETEVPLGMVRDVALRQSLGQRLLRAGDLVVDLGATAEIFSWIPAPAAVRRELWRQVDARRRGIPSLAGELERLDGLRRRGVLTEGEFEAEKARLLRR
jgi:membrane protein YdbS with pleckstrin-like domain